MERKLKSYIDSVNEKYSFIRLEDGYVGVLKPEVAGLRDSHGDLYNKVIKDNVKSVVNINKNLVENQIQEVDFISSGYSLSLNKEQSIALDKLGLKLPGIEHIKPEKNLGKYQRSFASIAANSGAPLKGF